MKISICEQRKCNSGFTLVELMIVVVIVGILAAVAIPSYQSSIQKSRRADAQGALQQFRQAMERFYSQRYTYAGAAAGGANSGAPAIFSTKSPIDGAVTYYNLAIDDSSATTFTISAAPTATGGQNQDPCGTLTLTNTGVRGSATPANGKCWNQ
ncbi:MAG: type IV pilin protein [Pseudomonadales bacterium]